MSDDLNTLIGYQVQSTAEWRREKALQFPDDNRNLRAAEELERLAAQIDELEGSEIHAQIREATDRIGKNWDSFGWDINEAVSSELRSIGFHSSYDAMPFLQWYRDLLREKLLEKLDEELDEAVPIPDLHEQVANDPAVKTAKQAYDEAYAKAYAEARKKL